VTRYYKRAVTIVDAEQLGGAMNGQARRALRRRRREADAPAKRPVRTPAPVAAR